MEWSRIQSKKHTITNTLTKSCQNSLNVCSHHTQGKWYISGAGVCEPASSLKFPLLLERTRYFRQLPNFPPMCWCDGNETIMALNVSMKSKMKWTDGTNNWWGGDGCTFCAPYLYSRVGYDMDGWEWEVAALYLSLFILFIAQNFKIRTKKVVNLEDLINLFFDYIIKHIHSLHSF